MARKTKTLEELRAEVETTKKAMERYEPWSAPGQDASLAHALAVEALREAESQAKAARLAAEGLGPESFEDRQRRTGQRDRVEEMRSRLYERLAKVSGTPQASRVIDDILVVSGTLRELEEEETATEGLA